MVSARTPGDPEASVDFPDGHSHLTQEKVYLAFDGIEDLIRLTLEDPERVPAFDGQVHVIIVDDRDPEWSAGNLVRGAQLLREGKHILVHQVTHRS